MTSRKFVRGNSQNPEQQYPQILSVGLQLQRIDGRLFLTIIGLVSTTAQTEQNGKRLKPKMNGTRYPLLFYDMQSDWAVSDTGGLFAYNYNYYYYNYNYNYNYYSTAQC
jgi:hypothetical protein